MAVTAPPDIMALEVSEVPSVTCKRVPMPIRERPRVQVYIASSWRNAAYRAAVHDVRAAGYTVHDWQDPEGWFDWSDVDKNCASWTPEQFLAGLDHPIADQGFGRDLMGMLESDVFLLLLPCGASAHLEAGWAVGNGKPVCIVLDAEPRAELMYKLADRIVTTLLDAIEWIADVSGPGYPARATLDPVNAPDLPEDHWLKEYRERYERAARRFA